MSQPCDADVVDEEGEEDDDVCMTWRSIGDEEADVEGDSSAVYNLVF